MNPLTPEQIEALRQLDRICRHLRVEAVIIGAVAYRILVRDSYRHTLDVDAAVALDLDDWPHLTDQLKAAGWEQNPRTEHRWEAASGARLDLIPAGPALRRQGQVVWPISRMKMSLAGFEHVFESAVPYLVAPDLSVNVVPLPTLVLLKITSYLDNPHVREKDIHDLATLLSRYDPDDEERFNEDVFTTGLDYGDVPAYLIGKKLSALCSLAEARRVSDLLSELQTAESHAFRLFSRTLGDREEVSLALIAALARGLQSGTSK